MDLEKINFGEWQAEGDEHLKDVFVQTADFEKILLPIHSIIVGRKGSGKSAVIRGIGFDYAKQFEKVIEIEADQIDFKIITNIYKNITKNLLGIYEFRKAMTNMWYHAMIGSVMNEICNNTPTYAYTLKDEIKTINNYLRMKGFAEKSIYDLLIDVLDSIQKASLSVLSKTDMDKIEKSSIARIIANYPLEKATFDKAFDALKKVLHHSRGYLITFDNVDRYFDSNQRIYWNDEDDVKILRIIFEGLVYAVYDLCTSEIKNKIRIKALIPTDKFSPLAMRDGDKIHQFVKQIGWTKDELRSFVCKRIAASLEIKETDGIYTTDPARTWYTIFPQFVTNQHVERKEDSFDYLLRHTLYRPRDLQMYCSKVIEHAISEKKPINEEMIRRVVTEEDSEIVRFSLSEYGFEYPQLSRILDSFREESNILTYSDVFNLVKKGLRLINDPDMNKDEKIAATKVENTIKFLYEFGLLGFMRENTNQEDSSKFFGVNRSFHFHYTDSCPALNRERYLVIHPMFYETLNISADKKIIVG